MKAATAFARGERLELSVITHCPRGWPLTASSQCQASCTATNEVVQGVIWLLSDLGTDTGGKAKHRSDSSCSKEQWGLEVGKLRQCRVST